MNKANDSNQLTGNDLAKLLKEHRITVNSAAAYMGVDRNTIMNYKRRGDSPIPNNRMVSIVVKAMVRHFKRVQRK